MEKALEFAEKYEKEGNHERAEHFLKKAIEAEKRLKEVYGEK